MAVVLVVVVIAVVLLALLALPGTSPIPGVRDADGDGVTDDRDAFPNDATQWADRDGDGHGDNPAGFEPDAFPDDPNEWRDSDRDGVGDNADVYDAGNAGVRIRIVNLAVSTDCDFWTACDPYFVFEVDGNNDGVFECTATSPTYQDVNVLANPSSAFVVCDIPDGAATIRFVLRVYDDDALNPAEPIDYTPESGSAYIYSIGRPFAETGTENGDGSNGYAAQLTWRIEVIGL